MNNLLALCCTHLVGYLPAISPQTLALQKDTTDTRRRGKGKAVSDLAVLVDTDTRVGGAEVDADGCVHLLLLAISFAFVSSG